MLRKFLFLLISLALFSCKKENEGLLIQDLEKKNQASLQQINSAWNVTIPNVDPEISKELNNWKDFQNFIREIKQKPNSSINAYKLKVTNLSNRADSLYLNTPARFNKPQVRSRLVAMHTQLQALDTYFSLDVIPIDKVAPLLMGLNKELNAFYQQCNEIVVKSRIPDEIGEKQMISALDATRNAKEVNFDELESKEKEAENNLQGVKKVEAPKPGEQKK